MAKQPAPPPSLGRRIVVWGATGSGKSTAAQALAGALHLAFIELDAVHWRILGWVEPELEDFRRDVAEALSAAPGGWVCAGSYVSKLGDRVLGQADTLIWLHLPWRVSFWRVLKRSLTRAWTKELMWGTQRESFSETFFHKDSILWWSISHHREGVRVIRQRLASLPDHVGIYELRSVREVEALLASAVAKDTVDARL